MKGRLVKEREGEERKRRRRRMKTAKDSRGKEKGGRLRTETEEGDRALKKER